MRIMRGGPAVMALAVVLGAASAFGGSDGLVFRAVGFYKGVETVSETSITCQIPNITSAIADSVFAMGMWNTFGEQTIMFPNPNAGFANPCGGWLQLRNALLQDGLTVDHVDIRFRIAGAKRLRDMVPTRRQFPVNCSQFRKNTLFAGVRLDPVNSTTTSSDSGLPNVAFLQLVPIVTPDLINCLQVQYGGLQTSAFVSLPLIAKVTAFAVSDSGDSFTSNTVSYTLNLRHLCGNGRVDDGEQCDPNAPNSCPSLACNNGVCGSTARACTTSADCGGRCTNVTGVPIECTCVY